MYFKSAGVSFTPNAQVAICITPVAGWIRRPPEVTPLPRGKGSHQRMDQIYCPVLCLKAEAMADSCSLAESPALARMGLRRLEEAMPEVVKRQEWRLRPVLCELPGQTGDQTPEWRVDFKRFPESKVESLPMLMLARLPLQGPARGDGRSGASEAEMRYQEGEQASDGDTGKYTGVIRNWRYLTAVGIFVGKIGASSSQNFLTWSLEENHAWLMLVYVKIRIEMQRR